MINDRTHRCFESSQAYVKYEGIGLMAVWPALTAGWSEGFCDIECFQTVQLHNPTNFIPNRIHSGMVARPTTDVPMTTRMAVAGSPE